MTAPFKIREFHFPEDYNSLLHLWKGIEKGVHVGRSDTLDEIEKKIASADERIHGVLIAHIRDVDGHAIADVVNVERVSAVFGDQTVDQRDFCAKIDKTASER